MRWLVALLLLTAATPGTAKRERPPNWDCSLEVSEGSDIWKADDFSLEWYRFTETRALLSFTVLTSTAAMKQSLRANGPLEPSLWPHFHVGPRVAYARQPLWVEVAAGGRSLGPERVGKNDGFYTGVLFPLSDIQPMLDGTSDIVVTFYFKDGTILDRASISPADLRAAIDRLVPLFEQHEARVAHPEGQCIDHNEDIIIVD